MEDRTARHRLVLPGHAQQVNAVRRALLAHVPSHAPSRVRILRNTTSHADEYLAQRIGLIPFCGTPTRAELRVSGRNATAADFCGAQACYPCTPVALLETDQELSLSVEFGSGTGHDHARFCRVAGVGMRPLDDGTHHELSFETLHPGDSPRALARAACAAVRAELQRLRGHVVGGTPS